MNAASVLWTPSDFSSLSPIAHIKINCLSTDFRQAKGRTGEMLRIQVKTYLVDAEGNNMIIHEAHSQIRVYVDPNQAHKEDQKRRSDELRQREKTVLEDIRR